MPRPFRSDEDEVLLEYVHRPVPSWPELMRRLPGRSQPTAAHRLVRLRREAGTVWTIPTGGYWRTRGMVDPRDVATA